MQTKKNSTKKIENKDENRRVSSLISLGFILFFTFFSLSTNAQCAMCRAALESEGNGVKAQAVNDGIVYLMAIPYILAAIVGYVVYRIIKKK